MSAEDQSLMLIFTIVLCIIAYFYSLYFLTEEKEFKIASLLFVVGSVFYVVALMLVTKGLSI